MDVDAEACSIVIESPPGALGMTVPIVHRFLLGPCIERWGNNCFARICYE